MIKEWMRHPNSRYEGEPRDAFNERRIKEMKILVVTEMPKSWRILHNASTAPNGYAWISNKKSRFCGKYKHALLKL